MSSTGAPAPTETGGARPPASVLVCHACGHRPPPEEPYPFRCPRADAGDGGDHVLRRRLDVTAVADPAAVFDDPEPNPFVRYRRLAHGWLTVPGLTDGEHVELIRGLDDAVARVDGGGFRETPLAAAPGLARHLGVGAVRVKDETGNVTGTHKGRHLMGVQIWLRLMERVGRTAGLPSRLLAAASCGNAALAAAVVARAAGRRLRVFVPRGARRPVAERLRTAGAELVVCDRAVEPHGDPCYLYLRQALRGEALPFTCQGNENGLVADGGATLAFEAVSALRREGAAIDRLFVQVGGGALAAACYQGLDEARRLGVLDRLPAFHAVQTAAAWPLARAWARLARRLLGESADGPAPPAPEESAALAARVASRPGAHDEALAWAASHRAELMWPWERTPKSVAYSIVDDETYDWLAVVEAMVRTGGYPVIVSEEALLEANELGRSLTGIPGDATATAGLAGALAVRAAGLLRGDESVALLFTGVERDAG